jgi:hypothetical protein
MGTSEHTQEMWIYANREDLKMCGPLLNHLKHAAGERG